MSFSAAQQSAAANTQGGSSDRRDDAQAQPSTPRTPGKAFHKNRSRRLDGDREDISKLHCILSDQFRPLPEVEEDDDRVVRGPTAGLFPLCATASYKFKGDPILRERLKDACVYGYQHLGPDRDVLHLPNLLTLSRSECITFKQELQLLDQVVGYVWKDGTTEEPAFFIDEEDHDRLMHMLENRLASAKPIFRDQKRLLPPLPRWGKGLEYIRYAFCANDFEILGACFRRQVESFLAQLTTLCDFKTERDPPQSEEDHAAIVPSIPPDPFRTSFKDRPSPPPLPTSLKQEITSQSFPPLPEERTAKDARAWRHRARSPSGERHSTAREDQRVQMYRAVQTPLPPSVHDRISNRSSHLQRASPTPAPQGTLTITGGDTTTALAMNATHQGDCDETRRMSDAKHHAGHRTKHETLGTDAPLVTSTSATPSRAIAGAPQGLKMDVVPTWDGDTATLARWIIRVNSIAKKSATIRQQLEHVREVCEQDWEYIRNQIGDYFMNRSWMEKTRKQALAIRYRDSACPRELPSQYFIRKRELLELAYENSESELISDIMAGAPRVWNTILTPRIYRTTSELQQAIKLHEDDLLEMEHLLPERPV
ncbi:hypothetical protein VTO73DRAFT_9321 [Trametes versicolor]